MRSSFTLVIPPTELTLKEVDGWWMVLRNGKPLATTGTLSARFQNKKVAEAFLALCRVLEDRV